MLTLEQIKELDHFGLNMLSESEISDALNVASYPLGDPLVCSDNDNHQSLALVFWLAAEDYISFLDPPYYVQDSIGIQLTEIAMKLNARTKYVKHPYVYASRILEITAMSVIVNGSEYTRLWVKKYNLLQKLPKGWTTDLSLDIFYKLIQLTIKDLIGMPNESIPHPYTIKQKLVSYLKHQLIVHTPTKTLPEPRAIIGLALWADILNRIQRRLTNSEEIGERFNSIDKIMGDMYNFQGIMWARAAYVSKYGQGV